MTEPKKVYWDACVWISLINRDPGRVDCCEHLIKLAEKGDAQIWTSSLTLAEVFKKKCDDSTVSLAAEKDADFEQYVQQEFFIEAQVDHDVGVMARTLLRQHPELKKPNDAVHLATAALNNLDELHTFDGDNLLALNGKIMRRDGNPLIICEPPQPTNLQLQLGLDGNGSTAKA